ncbi:MAG: hypothetical protein IPH16_04995 [Haliscomenobacter sp.]|nr:hypothetical protein [Haliscomenobacter sp.]
MPRAVLLFAATAFLLFSCRKPDTQVSRGIYHWQTRLSLSQEERVYLNQLGIRKLYVRFFDADWDPDLQEVVPLAQVLIDSASLDRSWTVTPCVFIANRAIRNLPQDQIGLLAKRIQTKIEDLAKTLPAHTSIPEVQIDCDWTASTRQAYFLLLQRLKEGFGQRSWQLSVTIRMHQLKYPDQTGVPPADRGMLMAYNTGRLEDWEETNSIFSEEQIAPYLKGLAPYPLPLDLALPAFRWGVVFRDGRLIRLVHGLDQSALRDSARFLETDSNRFVVRKSTYIEGYYLYQGDRIRLEEAGAREMELAAGRLAPVFGKAPSLTVAVYHLEPSLLQRIPHETMVHVFETFR